MMGFALALLLLLLATPASAAVFFDEDFETAIVPVTPPTTLQQFGGWTIRRNTYPDGREHCTFTTEQAHSGTKSVRLDYTSCCAQSNFDACDVSLVSDFPHVPEIYVRLWVYGVNYATSPANQPCTDAPSPPCIGGNGHSKRMYFHMFSPSNNAQPAFVPENYGENTPDVAVGAFAQDCWPQNTYGGTGSLEVNCDVDPGPAGNSDLKSYLASAFVANNVWQCLEYHFKLNDVIGGVAQSNAVVESWINGTLAMSYTNWRIRPSVGRTGGSDILFGPFNPGIYRQSAIQGAIVYVDDVAVGDTRIGCPVGGGPDVTPPTITITGPTSNPTFLTRVSPLEAVVWLTLTLAAALGVVRGHLSKKRSLR
jgi:hypothetical protein